MHRLAALLLAGALAGTISAARVQDAARASERPTVVVRQAGEADVIGNDDVALRKACECLRGKGGTLLIGSGRYLVRRTIALPANVVVRGEDGAVLALPSPALTAEAAAAGAHVIVLAGAHEFAGEGLVQFLPPIGSETFGDGLTKSLELQEVASVEGRTLRLREGLALALPAGSRVGYPAKILLTAERGLTRIENLTFEGGRIESIPMPGHSQRCGIWSASPYGEGKKAPPGQGVHVVNCCFTDWYGRGVALYNMVDGSVEDCRFERIADEAIDLDHYVERFTIRGNTIRDAVWGVVLNDASRNLVEGNTIEGGEIGIYSWWYDEYPPDLNQENVIRKNTIRGTRGPSILIERTCVRYVIEGNSVAGEIRVVEPENTVRDNVRL